MDKSRMVAGLITLLLFSIPVMGQQPAGRGSAAVPADSPAVPAGVDNRPRLLPGTRADVFSTIQGNALNSANTPLSNTLVRLRDARIGRIVDAQLTDQSGLFAFHSIDPGSYIVEIMDANHTVVLAASQVLNASAGEAISAVVKMPFRAPAFAGVLGTKLGSLAVVTGAAAAAGVVATQAAGAPTCEQVR
jgi:hypothetical protein